MLAEEGNNGGGVTATMCDGHSEGCNGNGEVCDDNDEMCNSDRDSIVFVFSFFPFKAIYVRRQIWE